MKKLGAFFIITFSIISLLGCQKGILEDSLDQKLIIKKRVGQINEYEDHKEITDKDQIKVIQGVLHDALWEDMKVQMARPPDYRMDFEILNETSQLKAVDYLIWFTPQYNRLEIIQENQDQYTKLSQKDSELLIKMFME